MSGGAGSTRELAVRLGDVSFTWAGRTPFTLEVPSLEIRAGETAFLSGASGSGKSTLLSLICGIAAPDRGVVEVDGTDLTGLNRASRDRFRAERIGVIFQMFNLLPYATPLDNIVLPLAFSSKRQQGLDDPKASALRLAQELGLDATMVAEARAGELSIGQQQRVAAARALIGRPSLVIADEPTSSLDAGAQRAFIDLLMEQVDQANATLLMVSHDERLADHFDSVLNLSEIATSTRAA